MEDVSLTPLLEDLSSPSNPIRRSPTDHVTSPQALKRHLDAGDRWLGMVELPGVDMEGVNLSQICIEEADFCGAQLRRANFRQTMVLNGDFCGADLRGANFCGADLTRALFCGADLCSANLSGARLTGANLSRARYNQNTRWPKGFDPVSAGAVIASSPSRQSLAQPESPGTRPWRKQPNTPKSPGTRPWRRDS